MELTSKKDIKKDFEHQKKITEELHSDWTEDDKARAAKMAYGKYREALEQRKKRTVLMTIKPQTEKRCKTIIEDLDSCTSMGYEGEKLTLTSSEFLEDEEEEVSWERKEITSYNDKGEISRYYSKGRSDENQVSRDEKGRIVSMWAIHNRGSENWERRYSISLGYDESDQISFFRHEYSDSEGSSRFIKMNFSYVVPGFVQVSAIGYDDAGDLSKSSRWKLKDGKKNSTTFFTEENLNWWKPEDILGKDAVWVKEYENTRNSEVFYEQGRLARIEYKDSSSKEFYDEQERLARIEHSNGSKELYSYDKNGKQHVKVIHSKQEIADKISDVLVKMGIRNSTSKPRKREAAVEMQ